MNDYDDKDNDDDDDGGYGSDWVLILHLMSWYLVKQKMN